MEANHFGSPGMFLRQLVLDESMDFVCLFLSFGFLEASYRHWIILLMIKDTGSGQGTVW